jgi:hypothetical protein
MCLAGQVHKLVNLGLVGYLVQTAQIPDVAEAGPARPGLQAADLRRREQKLFARFFSGQAEAGAEFA